MDQICVQVVRVAVWVEYIQVSDEVGMTLVDW